MKILRKPNLNKYFCVCGGQFNPIENQKIKCNKCGKTVYRSVYTKNHYETYAKKEEENYFINPDLE